MLYLFIPPSPTLWQPLIFFVVVTISKVLPSPECHAVGIIQHIAFSDWLLSVCIMHLKLIHVVSWFESLFLFCGWLIFHLYHSWSIHSYHSLFIHSLIQEHPCCFQFFVIVNKFAINMHALKAKQARSSYKGPA